MRLDVYLVEAGYFPSRQKAREAVERGDVSVGGKTVLKPSKTVLSGEAVTVSTNDERFVSNGGYKLYKAFQDFKFSPKGLVFADIGASNGGFTDCLLKFGAEKVIAIDVGESQLDKTLACNERVVIKDNFNARYLTAESLGGFVDGVTADVSFISLTYILKNVADVLKDGGVSLLLIKPQFELNAAALNKNGLVTSDALRKSAVKRVYDFALSVGLVPVDFTVAPVKEKKNVEYVIMLKKDLQISPISLKTIEERAI